MFYFQSWGPYLGKIPILTNIFQMGWNHQLDGDLIPGSTTRCYQLWIWFFFPSHFFQAIYRAYLTPFIAGGSAHLVVIFLMAHGPFFPNSQREIFGGKCRFSLRKLQSYEKSYSHRLRWVNFQRLSFIYHFHHHVFFIICFRSRL